LFDEFSSEFNSDENTLWEFGLDSESPSMVLPMGNFIDAAGDGQVDSWPAKIASAFFNPIPPVPDPVPDSNSGSGGAIQYMLLLMLLSTVFRRSRTDRAE
jgi:hypothetical protein